MEWGNLWLLAAIAVLSFALSFIGAAVGLILGHLRLPLLITYLGGPAAGAATNLITSGVGALSGSLKHVRDGRVSWHCLGLMGVPSACGAALGAYLFTRVVNPFWSYLVIGGMLVVSGVNLVRPSQGEEQAADLPALWSHLLEVLIGLGLGVLAAVTGLMLGSLRLPMMMRVLKLDPKVAAGSNMAIGCLTAMVGAATTFAAGKDLPWPRMVVALAVVGPPTVLGGWLGGWLTGRLTKDSVRRLAGWIIAVTGLMMVGQGVWPLTQQTTAEVPEFTVPDDDDDVPDADDD
jgi:uncharacterized membrane protein YfcA